MIINRVNSVLETVLVVLLVWGTLIRPASMAAQTVPSSPVRIAVPDSFPAPGAVAMVLRYNDLTDGDVILLERSALRPEVLGSAIVTLRATRRHSAVAGSVEAVMITGGVPMRRLPPGITARLRRTLTELQAQPVTQIGNLGRGRWIELAQARVSP